MKKKLYWKWSVAVTKIWPIGFWDQETRSEDTIRGAWETAGELQQEKWSMGTHVIELRHIW